MAASVTAHYNMRLQVEETIGTSLDLAAADPTFVHDISDTRATLNASSTPAVTKAMSDTINLVAGASTLDLTSLTGPAGAAVTFSGLKVQCVKLSCPTTNTAGITVGVGAANGYNLFGEDNASAEQVEILPGCACQFFLNDKTEDVDATHKNVDFAGTGTEAISVVLVAG